MPTPSVTHILFDYGGVLAREGFHDGLQALARQFGLDPELVASAGTEAVHDSGYLTGQGREEDFWSLLCARTGLPDYRPQFTHAILDRFQLRPALLDAVDQLRSAGLQVVILSDQTDWLDRLDRRDGFFAHFDRVFNSYYLGKGKRDPSLFRDVAITLAAAPGNLAFIDDNPGHIERARRCGLHTHLFTATRPCLEFLHRQTGIPLCP